MKFAVPLSLLALASACAVDLDDATAPPPTSSTTQMVTVGAGPRRRLELGDVPIWGLAAKLHDGELREPDVRYVGGPVAARPRLSPEEATAAALAALTARSEAGAVAEAADLVWLPHEELRPRPPAAPRRGRVATAELVQVVEAEAARAAGVPQRERVITSLTLIYRVRLARAESAAGGRGEWLAQVDAATGSVLALDSIGVGVDEFRAVTGLGKFVGQKSLTAWYLGTEREFELRDVYGNTYEVFDGTSILPLMSPDASFGDGQFYNPANDPDSPNGETAAVDAFYAADLTQRCFGKIFQRASPGRNPRPIKFRLHATTGYTSQYFAYQRGPQIEVGYAGVDRRTGRLIPGTTVDIVGHELGHDFFSFEVFAEPWNAPTGNSELKALGEATSDIVGMVTEMYRDVYEAGQPPAALNSLPLLRRYVQVGDQTGVIPRDMLDPIFDQWFAEIGAEEPHAASGPISRMFVLLAYGCLPDGTSPGWPARTCPRLPNGFPGIGAGSAAALWASTVAALPEGASFAQAREFAMNAATVADGGFGGPKTKAVADAFAAVNIGEPADRGAPIISNFTCTQMLRELVCAAQISDAEIPFLHNREPRILLDGRSFLTTSGWAVNHAFPESELTDGPHVVVLEAWDAWNNHATQTLMVSYDGAPPTASLAVSGPPKFPHLQITATDPSGVGGVSFYDGATHLGDRNAPYELLIDTNAWTDGDHDVSARVFDVYGNAVTLHTTIHVDNTAPVVSLQVSGATPPFVVSALIADDSPISQAVFKADGVAIGTAFSPPYFVYYAPSDGANHTLSVVVTDALGNVGTAFATAPKDVTPPEVTFSASQHSTVVTLVTSVADPCGIANPWAIAVDGIVVEQPTTPTYVLALGTSLAVGVHVFQAVVTDRCGNTKNFVTTFEKVPNVPPVITAVTRDDTIPKKPKFTVQCVDTDGIDHVEVRKDGVVLQIDTTAPYEFVIDTSTWPDGDSAVLFHCSDTLGAASDPVTRTVTADNTPPTFVFSVHGAGHTYQVAADGVSDAHAIQSVQLAGGLGIPSFNLTLSVSPYRYTWGIPSNISIQTSMPFWVVAKDTWGNERAEQYWCYMNTSTTQPAYLSCGPE